PAFDPTSRTSASSRRDLNATPSLWSAAPSSWAMRLPGIRYGRRPVGWRGVCSYDLSCGRGPQRARAAGPGMGRMTGAFDEMNGGDGTLRPAYGELSRWLARVPPDVLDYRRREAELLFRRIGITFAVDGEAEAQERLIPFDVLPRI